LSSSAAAAVAMALSLLVVILVVVLAVVVLAVVVVVVNKMYLCDNSKTQLSFNGRVFVSHLDQFQNETKNIDLRKMTTKLNTKRWNYNFHRYLRTN
jgi:hypothetical protein